MSKKEDYSTELQYLAEKEAELAALQAAAYGSGGYNSAGLFGGQQKQNLVEWQLDFKPELEDIEHLIRCDVLERDDNGNESWQRNKFPERIVFNDLGVHDILRIIRMFLNKNTVLSNYREEEVRPRVKLFANALNRLIYNNYERYGIDNEYKKANYPMMVLSITAMIESAYRRAIDAEERRDLNQARVVQQNEPMMPAQTFNMYQPQQKKGFLSKAMPWNWNK